MYTWDTCAATNNNNNSSSNGVAPFIMKTYQMVSDPRTDHLIAWGRANNSFIVVDPIEFSQRILPSNFKHNNFSSFVRQLNTYGFKKVDPDRWEFANEWFLRGQKHLLKNIARRKHSPNLHQQIVLRRSADGGWEAEHEEMVSEIERLKRAQSEMERELQEMTRRLEATERRPEQMVAFLCRVVEDPEILTRMVVERERRSGQRQICSGAGEKKRRLIATSSSSSSLREAGAATMSDSGKTAEVEGVCGSSSSTEYWSPGWSRGGGVAPLGCRRGTLEAVEGVSPAEDGGSGGEVGGFCGVSAVGLEAETRPPPYPFSLFGGGI